MAERTEGESKHMVSFLFHMRILVCTKAVCQIHQWTLIWWKWTCLTGVNLHKKVLMKLLSSDLNSELKCDLYRTLYLNPWQKYSLLVMDIVDETVKFVPCESKQSTCPGIVFLFLQAIRTQGNGLFRNCIYPCNYIYSDWDHSDLFFLVRGWQKRLTHWKRKKLKTITFSHHI